MKDINQIQKKWGNQYDKTVRFRPKIISNPLPSRYLLSKGNELWIPHLPFCPANIGHLIWDDYLTWFLFSWAAKPFLSFSEFFLRPLWYNPPFDPPWATCDWIRLHEGPGHSLAAGYSNRCIKNNARWLSNMIGEGNEVMIETKRFSPQQKEEIVCFSKSILGLTPFANQGSGHHGWRSTDSIPPSFGRAPLLYQFRKHMMKMVKAHDIPKRSLKELVITFSSRSSDRVSLDFTNHANMLESNIKQLNELVSKTTGRDDIKIVIRNEIFFKYSALEQINITRQTCVYVTAAGGGAFTAQFLPRGSAIILYESRSGEHLHEGRVDWKFFNAASWMRPTFLDVRESSNYNQLLQMVKSELLNCLAFMEALDV